MEDEKKRLLRGKKKLGKPVFNNILFGWLYAQNCFPMQDLDATLRGKSEELGKNENATLSDRDKNIP